MLNGLDDQISCRYGLSRVFCRGPKRNLTGRYTAFVGSTLTFAPGIAQPFPQRVEAKIGAPCINFGVRDSGVDLLLAEPVLMQACLEARAVVIEITGALNHSNRFYRVHPQRNNQITWVSPRLRSLFSNVDFSPLSTAECLITRLHQENAAYFEMLRRELADAWLERMHHLLDQFNRRVLLTYVGAHALDDVPWTLRPDDFGDSPLFVTAAMVDELRPKTFGVIEVIRPATGAAICVEGRPQSPVQSDALHENIAGALVPELEQVLDLVA